MLMRLLREHLRPYRGAVAALLVFQLVQTLATLYLPNLNARIIDKGVTAGDTKVIWQTGGWMLAVSLGQVVAAVIATYFGARTAMQFGRDLRQRLFGHVQEFSAQEVAKFGAPTLITRTTNDVQQV
ncbi:MAG: ABC transporter ATP-binding protein, partial [Actinobacteria bacterium]|nr:ABC transporter ATP-binding protein [Actinomycetota bacterium]